MSSQFVVFLFLLISKYLFPRATFCIHGLFLHYELAIILFCVYKCTITIDILRDRVREQVLTVLPPAFPKALSFI